MQPGQKEPTLAGLLVGEGGLELRDLLAGDVGPRARDRSRRPDSGSGAWRRSARTTTLSNDQARARGATVCAAAAPVDRRSGRGGLDERHLEKTFGHVFRTLANAGYDCVAGPSRHTDRRRGLWILPARVDLSGFLLRDRPPPRSAGGDPLAGPEPARPVVDRDLEVVDQGGDDGAGELVLHDGARCRRPADGDPRGLEGRSRG